MQKASGSVHGHAGGTGSGVRGGGGGGSGQQAFLRAGRAQQQQQQQQQQHQRSTFTERPVRFKCSLGNTVLDVMRSRGWTEVHGENDWDIYWCDTGWMKECFDHCYLEEHTKISHFRNHYELTRKNLMVKNLKRYRKQLEKDGNKAESNQCDFYPMTYELPAEYHIFVEEFKRNPGHIYIMKPVARSQGKGIFLFRKLKDITEWKRGEYQLPMDPNRDTPETYVVQRYLESPYLINGRKYDLRIYVLVTSFSPLRVWLHRTGFARFSNARYATTSIDDVYVHLTNVAVQKTSPDYDPEKGAKWSVRQLRMYLTARHGATAVERLLRQIDNIIVRSLLSVQKVMINDKHSFELYGYDVLLDSRLKPWLIEVNASPSLTASSREDYRLKYGLLQDALDVVDIERKLKPNAKRVGGFDLIYDGKPPQPPPSQPSSSAQPDDGQTPPPPAAFLSSNCFLGGFYEENFQNLENIFGK